MSEKAQGEAEWRAGANAVNFFEIRISKKVLALRLYAICLFF